MGIVGVQAPFEQSADFIPERRNPGLQVYSIERRSREQYSKLKITFFTFQVLTFYPILDTKF